MRLIKYNSQLHIVNLDHLALGVGAKYLLCLEDDLNKSLIAKAWKRKMPKLLRSDEAIVEF